MSLHLVLVTGWLACCAPLLSVTSEAAEPPCHSSDGDCAVLGSGLVQMKRLLERAIPSADLDEESEEEPTFRVTCDIEHLPGDMREDGQRLGFGECITDDRSMYYLLDDHGPVDQILPGDTVELELEEIAGHEYDFPGAPWVSEGKALYRVDGFTRVGGAEGAQLLEVQGGHGGATAAGAAAAGAVALKGNRYVVDGWRPRCPKGTMSVRTQAECHSAASYVGRPWGWAGSFKKAGPGCMVGCKNKVYFNYDFSSPGAWLICKTVQPCFALFAPIDCASCTEVGGYKCEQCVDGTTLLADGTCKATCADFKCPEGFAEKADTRPLLDPDVDKCCVDGRKGIVQGDFGATQCPAGTAPLDEQECEKLAQEGSLAVKDRRGDLVPHPADYKVTLPTWIVFKRCPSGCNMATRSGKVYYWNTNPNPSSAGYRSCSLVCKLPAPPTPAPQPPAPTAPAPGPMPPAQRDAILGKHNSVRAQEGSSSMPKLVWDPALEASSRRWADKCSFSHAMTSADSYGDCASNACGQQHGENLWMGSAGDPDLEGAVQQWYNEGIFYMYGDGIFNPDKCFVSDNGCGHYTQLVSASTLRVGCAVKTDCPGQWKSYIVCQYDPPGNFVGDMLYKKGAACSECPVGYSSCEGGLCVGNSSTALTPTPAPMPVKTMQADPSSNGKKCGVWPTGLADRLFTEYGGAATEADCKQKCLEKDDCVAMSGVFGEFCIGCKTQLAANHPGSVAFKRATALAPAPAPTLAPMPVKTMQADPSSNGKKCGVWPTGLADRLFTEYGGAATEADCKQKCLQNDECVAMSGVFGEFCIGCKTQLAADHPGSVAFKTTP